MKPSRRARLRPPKKRALRLPHQISSRTISLLAAPRRRHRRRSATSLLAAVPNIGLPQGARLACLRRGRRHARASDQQPFGRTRRETLASAPRAAPAAASSSQLCTEFSGSSRFFAGGIHYVLKRSQERARCRSVRQRRSSPSFLARSAARSALQNGSSARERLEGGAHLDALDHRHRRTRRRHRGQAGRNGVARPRRPEHLSTTRAAQAYQPGRRPRTGPICSPPSPRSRCSCARLSAVLAFPHAAHAR